MTVRDDHHAPTARIMQDLGDYVNQYLSQVAIDGKQVSFALLLWPEGQISERVNYVSNVRHDDRDHLKDAMAEVIKRWNSTE